MARVTGIGGIFLKADKPDLLAAWYQNHLGMTLTPYSGVDFEWREKDSPETIGNTQLGRCSPRTRNTLDLGRSKPW